MSKLANDFLTAIGILTEDAVAKSGAVKMIKAIVSAVKVNEIDTNYKIKYQDTEFLAVGSAGYNKGDQVYVITPGDNTQTYFIHSKIQTNSNGEEIYQSETNKYDITSTNLISGSASAIGWDNDDEGSEIVLYDYDDPNPQPIEIRQDNNELANQFNETEVLQVQAKFIYNFEVNIDLYYDLVFTFITEEGKKLKYDFSINDMPNNPYVNAGQIVAKNFVLPEGIKILRLQSIVMSRNMTGQYQIQNMKIYGVVKNNFQVGYSTHIIADRTTFTKDNQADIILSAYMRKDGIKILDSTTDNTNVYYKWHLEDKPGEFKELTSSPNFWEKVDKVSTPNANQGSASWNENAISLIATGEDNYCIFTDFQPFEAGTYLLQAKSIAKGQLFILNGTWENYSVLGQSNQKLNPQVIFTSNGSDNIAFRVDNDAYDDSLEDQITNVFSDFKLIKLDSNELNLSIDDIFLAEKQVKCESFYVQNNGIFIAESNTISTLKNEVPNGIYSLTLNNISDGAPHLRKIIVNVKQPFNNNKTLKYFWKRNNVNIEEVSNNIKVNAAAIKDSEVYQCQVKDENDLYIGEIKTEILMIPAINANNRIVITGARSYLYNESGERIDGLPISNLEVFFYSADKKELIKWKDDNDPQKENFSIEWFLKSADNSMIILPTDEKLRKQNILTFSLKSTYDPLATNNIIKVRITPNEEDAIEQEVSIDIIKMGEPGTNGTQRICKIKPVMSATISDTYPDIIQIEENKNTTIVLTPKLFNNTTAEDIPINKASIIWEKQNSAGQWESFNYIQNDIDFNEINYICNEATIIRVTLKENNLDTLYYGYLTIATYNDSQFKLNPLSGYSHVLYSSSGNNPRYRDSQFTFETSYEDIKIQEQSKNLFNFAWVTQQNIESTTNGTSNVDYDNKTVTLIPSEDDCYVFVSDFRSYEPGQYKFFAEHTEGNTQFYATIKTEDGGYHPISKDDDNFVEFTVESKDDLIALRIDNDSGKNNEITFSNFMLIKIKDLDKTQLTPPEKYSSITSSVQYIFTANNNSSKIVLPILHLINRYEYAVINGWDGESITLDEENGTVLSPIAGFGSKDIDNTFTGVVLGEVQKPEEEVRHGIFGLNNGVETFSLNAESGEAIFGSEGAGQIKLTPNWVKNAEGKEEYKPQALIMGGKFDLDGYTPGKEMTSSSGMIINLTKPEIRWGSGDFIVDESGHLTAVNGTFSGSLSSPYFTADATNQTVQIGALNKGIFVDSQGEVTINKDVKIQGDIQAAGLTITTEEGNIIFNAQTSDPDKVKIGNFTVKNNGLLSGFQGDEGSVYLGTDLISLGANFSVNNEGYLKSTQGEIANWNISSSSLDGPNKSISYIKGSNPTAVLSFDAIEGFLFQSPYRQGVADTGGYWRDWCAGCIGSGGIELAGRTSFGPLGNDISYGGSFDGNITMISQNGLFIGKYDNEEEVYYGLEIFYTGIEPSIRYIAFDRSSITQTLHTFKLTENGLTKSATSSITTPNAFYVPYAAQNMIPRWH